MLFNISLLEWIGYLASVIVAISLTMSSIKRLRWLNLIGAAVFSFYGFAIQAYPVGGLNLFIVFANIYYLIRMYSYKESFKAIVVKNTDVYLQYFIEFHSKQISSFFPNFKQDVYLDNLSDNVVSILLIRNAVVAGVFIGVREGDDLRVVIDFVAPAYRDLKPGEFIYQNNKTLFSELGVQKFRCVSGNKIHKKYLAKMGFSFENAKNEVYVKPV
jgi:hypothetical protein